MPATVSDADDASRSPSAVLTIVLVREYDAPRELVFEAWTKAEHVSRWWGPRGWTAPECTVDPRPGGRWRLMMRSPADFELATDGKPYDQWVGGRYLEVVRPSRIVFTAGFVEGPKPVQDYQVTVALDEIGPKRTRLTLTLEPESAVELAKLVEFQAEVGWGQTLDMLGEFLAGTR